MSIYDAAGDNSVTALTRLSIAAFRFPCVAVNTALMINSESLFDQTLLRGEVPGVTRLYLA
jgi:hypothetical protein